MTRKPAVHLSALVLAALALTGCGGGDDESSDDSTAPTPTMSEETSAATEEPPEPTAEPTEAASDEASEETGDGAGGAGSGDPGPAPDGAVLPAEVLQDPPAEVDGFSLQAGSGPAHLYSNETRDVLISANSSLLQSPYASLAESIKTKNTPAGTGSCGTNEAGTSITCYLRVEGGVMNLDGVPEEISLQEMVVFANQFAAAAGAA